MHKLTLSDKRKIYFKEIAEACNPTAIIPIPTESEMRAKFKEVRNIEKQHQGE